MAEKKAIIINAPAATLAGEGAGLGKLLKKGALLNNFSAGNIMDGAVAEATITRLKADELIKNLEAAAGLIFVDMSAADAATLDALLAAVFEEADRRTTVAVLGKDAALLYGAGINPKAGSVARAAQAADILPTLAYIADFPLTEACSGAIIYQALKNPNLKMEELGKLKEALARMESVVARDNREPWDKHDCA